MDLPLRSLIAPGRNSVVTEFPNSVVSEFPNSVVTEFPNSVVSELPNSLAPVSAGLKIEKQRPRFADEPYCSASF